MTENSNNDVKRFGELVRKRREVKNWTQENLAAEAMSGSNNKGFISRIENGLIPNITVGTVRNISRALELDPEEIPPSLRPPGETEKVKDTNTVVREIQVQLENLIAAKQDQSREFGIKEGMLIALARNYVADHPDNYFAALAGLERALEIARDEHERGQLPPNTAGAVNAVIARIDSLNEDGDLEAGQATLDAELAVHIEEDQRRRADLSRLYDKGVAQAILTRSVENASRFAIASLDLEAPTDAAERYQVFRALYLEWFERGRGRGLDFDLEVAIALAREGVNRADTLDQRGAMRHSLGTALATLGEQKSGSDGLEQAVAAFERALEERTRERDPLGWAATQMGLGNTLRILGEQKGGRDRLEQSVAAYERALDEWTTERDPLNWATARMHQAEALTLIADRTDSLKHVEKAIAHLKAAFEIFLEAFRASHVAHLKGVLEKARAVRARLSVKIAAKAP